MASGILEGNMPKCKAAYFFIFDFLILKMWNFFKCLSETANGIIIIF